jgi:RNA polymerase subunit RPABC4/transcription elongation factor Spt4
LGRVVCGYGRISDDEIMISLVVQHCRECGGDFYTSKIDGHWVKIDAATSELVLFKFETCRLCGSRKVDKPFFDNGGFLIIEEEVAV